jgi:hypothetical protein
LYFEPGKQISAFLPHVFGGHKSTCKNLTVTLTLFS